MIVKESGEKKEIEADELSKVQPSKWKNRVQHEVGQQQHQPQAAESAAQAVEAKPPPLPRSVRVFRLDQVADRKTLGCFV